jgi:KUP system potassium uptake protein
MILLATAATVIAAQALISGAFTLVEQGIALNLIPRMRVLHTSNRYPGQVFVPAVNVALAIGCVLLVLAFKTSDALAAAYGLAVSLTMAATTILYVAVLRRVLKWNAVVAYGLFAAFILLDGSFVLAGLAKIPAGGWIPLAIGAALTFLASTWYDGKSRVLASLASSSVPLEQFIAEVKADGARTIEGTAVFLTSDPTGIPYILHHHWVRLQALNERIVLLTLARDPGPYVPDRERVKVSHLTDRLIRVEASFGFMELPDLQPVVASCKNQGLHIDEDKTAFFAASPQIVPGGKPRMPAIRRWFFDVMQKLSASLPRDLHIAPERLVELGVEVRL